MAFKIDTKEIVNFIKPIPSDFIEPVQASFILGCQLIDNVVIVQEVLHTMAAQGGSTKWMILKIDLEKAYDWIRWKFLEEILNEAQLP